MTRDPAVKMSPKVLLLATLALPILLWPVRADADEPAQTDFSIARVAALIDGLHITSDFTVFLGEGVPIRLHRQAMRKLWRLDPLFGRLDGLNEYNEDFQTLTHSLEV